jgi:hypothetical protein
VSGFSAQPKGGRHAPRPRPQPPQSSTPAARMSAVNLGRLVWLLTVLACLVAVLILLLNGYYGYAGVTLAVAISAAINLS